MRCNDKMEELMNEAEDRELRKLVVALETYGFDYNGILGVLHFVPTRALQDKLYDYITSSLVMLDTTEILMKAIELSGYEG